MFISQIRLCAFLLTENIKFRPDSIKLVCFVPRFTYVRVNDHNEIQTRIPKEYTDIAETTNEDITVVLKI
jgi:hypothetical protein